MFQAANLKTKKKRLFKEIAKILNVTGKYVFLNGKITSLSFKM